MADIANTVATANGLFKKKYAPKVKDAVPQDCKLCRRLPFDESKSVGDDYNAPVLLALENGFTRAAPGADPVTVKDAIASTTKNASPTPYQVALQAVVNFESASKASRKGEKAIESMVKHVVKATTKSHKCLLEADAWYGQADWGVVESAVSGASGTITITAATWSPGIWAGREGMKIDVLDATLANEIDSAMKITAINFATRTITFDNVDASVIAGHRLFLEDSVTAGGTPSWSEALGVHAALNNTGSIYGIDSDAFTLWDAPTIPAGGQPLEFDHTQALSSRIMEKGGMGKLTQFVAAISFADLVGDQAALRSYDEDGSTSRYRTGAKAITFYTGNGEVEIEPSIFVKQGFSYMLNLRTWSRLGSQDMSYSSPFSTEAFHVFEQKLASFVRSYSNLTPFCNQLAANGTISGIINSN